jgi:hypothetical protein
MARTFNLEDLMESKCFGKNLVGMAVLTLCLMGTLTGCATTVKELPPFDSNVGAEKSAALVIPTDTFIRRIDGAKRGTFSNWGSRFSVASRLLMPEGEHTITFNYSNLIEGVSADDLTYTTTMSAGKLYLLSCRLQDSSNRTASSFAIKTGASLISYYVGSFTLGLIVSLLPDGFDDAVSEVFSAFLPRQRILYRISEIDQTALDQYLLEENAYIKGILTTGILSTIITVALFVLAIFIFAKLAYGMFMQKFSEKHNIGAFILCVALCLIAVLVLSYNSGGNFFPLVVATLFIGIGLSPFLPLKKKRQ